MLLFFLTFIDMIIKPGHRHVDTEGVAMVPYISNWNSSNPASSSMLELCNVLCGVFSAEPPLFSKPVSVAGTASASPSYKQHTSAGGSDSSQYQSQTINYGSDSAAVTASAAYASTSSNANINATPSVANGIMSQYYNDTSTTSSTPNPVASYSTTGDSSGYYGNKPGSSAVTASPPAYVAGAGTASYYTTNTLGSSDNYAYTPQATNKRQELVDKLMTLLKSELHVVLSGTASTLEKEMETQQELETIKEVLLPDQLEVLSEQRQRYQEELDSINNKKTVALEAWEKEMEQLNSESGDESDKNDADDEGSESKVADSSTKFERLLKYDDLSLQLVKLTAENNAVDDTIYYLDHALAHGEGEGLDIQEVLKETRKLARKQFLCRTHVMKINSHVLSSS